MTHKGTFTNIKQETTKPKTQTVTKMPNELIIPGSEMRDFPNFLQLRT